VKSMIVIESAARMQMWRRFSCQFVGILQCFVQFRGWLISELNRIADVEREFLLGVQAGLERRSGEGWMFMQRRS
jgi:hypothetical protein